MLLLPAPPPAIIEAAKHTQDPALMMAISFVESSWRTNAVGKAGEIGALQLHPRYHTVPTTTKEQFKYAENYLRYLRKLCGEQLFLACYNAGPKKALDNRGGLSYTKKVTEVYRALKNNENRRTAARNKSKVRIATNY